MTASRPAESPNESAAIATRWINHGLEFLWLLTVVSVPLAFVDRESFLSELELAYVDVPKTVLLRILVGLVATLWIVEWALRRYSQRGYPIAGRIPDLEPAIWLRNLAGWLQRNPTRWVISAAIIYLLSTLLSTALSESVSVSMWGLVPGQDTYPAYTIVCYVVLFGVVATRVKSRAQVERLLWAVALMGTLVGGYSWAQYYGHDVFNLREVPGSSQSGSTMGNAIMAGSVLLMTITVSLAAATISLGQPVRSRRFWGMAGLWTLVLTVQMTALIFSSSRGPWVGSIAALVVLFGLAAVFTGWRSFMRLTVVSGLAAGLSAALVFMPPPIPTGEPTLIEVGRGYEIPPPSEASPLTQAVPGLATTIGRDVLSAGRGVGGGGLSGRIGIWETSVRLIVKRPWFESSSSSLPILRFFIGYGPDMFKYTYLLEKRPRGPGRTVTSERFAHNLFIHRGVELGLLGLFATLGLFVAAVMVAGYRLLHQERNDSTFNNLLMVGLLAALAGRFTEQLVGVAAVSDLTIFWVLLALFTALPLADRMPQTETPPIKASPRRRRSRRLTPTAIKMISGARIAAPAVMAICLIVGIGALTWTKSINYLEAGFKAREGLDRIRDAEFQNALVSLNQAIDLAPDVSFYHTLRAAVYTGYRRQDDGPREPECARLPGAAGYDACLASQVYSGSRQAAEQRPLDWNNLLNLAESALVLALVDRDTDKADEAIRLYREVAELDPRSWWQWERLAAAHIQIGQPESALEPLEKSLAILDEIPRSAVSRLLQGMAFLQLGDPGTALESFDEAIRVDPNLADAYTNRGSAYNALGQYQRAVQDLDEAIKLNPEIALAYINRGNSYGNLDQYQRAIEDYSEAVRLAPRFALAYSNRALAYTYIGKDDDARIDVEMVARLGVDPRPIMAKIERVRANR